jgi:hypothetical protein
MPGEAVKKIIGKNGSFKTIPDGLRSACGGLSVAIIHSAFVMVLREKLPTPLNSPGFHLRNAT